MIHSLIDTPIGEKEFALLRDQDHLDKVWSVMEPKVREYVDGYLEGISHYQDLSHLLRIAFRLCLMK